MDSAMGWISDTFSSTAKEDDLVKARSLNITRIAGVVTPVLAGIWTAISELTDTEPFDQPGFQKQLILALIGLIAVVTVADILGRAIATTKLPMAPAVATPLPNALKATKNEPTRADIAGQVVAFRALNESQPTSSGEYLFVAETGDRAASWEEVGDITLSTTQ